MSKTLGFPKNNIQFIKSQNLGKSYVLWPIPWNQIEASQLWAIDCFKKNSYLNFHEIGQKNLLLPRCLLFMNLNVILWKRQSFRMFTFWNHQIGLNQCCLSLESVNAFHATFCFCYGFHGGLNCRSKWKLGWARLHLLLQTTPWQTFVAYRWRGMRLHFSAKRHWVEPRLPT